MISVQDKAKVVRTAVPLDRYVVIERVQHSTSNIILGDTVKSNDMFDVVVVAVGPACTRGMKPGDVLILSDGVNAVQAGDNTDQGIIHETDIIGIEKVTVE